MFVIFHLAWHGVAIGTLEEFPDKPEERIHAVVIFLTFTHMLPELVIQ